MATYLSYVLADGSETKSYAEALKSGKSFIKRFREYNHFSNDITKEKPATSPDLIEDIFVL